MYVRMYVRQVVPTFWCVISPSPCPLPALTIPQVTEVCSHSTCCRRACCPSHLSLCQNSWCTAKEMRMKNNTHWCRCVRVHAFLCVCGMSGVCIYVMRACMQVCMRDRQTGNSHQTSSFPQCEVYSHSPLMQPCEALQYLRTFTFAVGTL